MSGRAPSRAGLLAALAVMGALCALWLPSAVQALALGEIQVRSKLNEPLDARIALRSLRGGEAESLTLQLADAEAFERAGIDRPFMLNQLRFAVVRGSGGGGYVGISTRQPVTEPFLNFLVEATSPQGRVLREYTILLDPPVYADRLAARTAAQAQPQAAPARGRVSQAPAFSGDSYRVRRGDTLYAIARRVRPSRSISAERMMLALQRANPRAFINDNINLLRSGVLLKVPTEGEISPIRRAEAVAEVNRQAEAWRAGAAAGAPKPAAPAAPAAPAQDPAQDSVKIVGADEAPPTVATTGTGAAAPSVSDESLRREQESLRQQLNLALEQADTARRENAELSARLDEAMLLIGELRNMMELKDGDIAALQSQMSSSTTGPGVAASTDGSVPVTPAPDRQPGDAAPGDQESQPDIASTAGQPETEPATGQPETATTAEAPEARPAPPPPPPAPTSTVDQVLDTVREYTGPVVDAGRDAIGSLARMLGVSETVAGGGAAGVVALMLLGLVGLRRRAKAARRMPVEDATRTVTGTSTNLGTMTDLGDARPATGPAAVVTGAAAAGAAAAAGTATQPAAVARADATATPTAEAGPASGAMVEAFAGDPMERVNVYLAYEQYSRAEEAVREAIARDPGNVDYRMRLLDVLRLARNPAAFEAGAGQLAAVAGEDAEQMNQVRAWWNEISPGRELDLTVAAEAAAEARHDTVELEGSESGGGTELEVDFDLGFQLESDAEAPATAEGRGTLDLDLGAGAPAAPSGTSGLDLDLDLGAVGADAAPAAPATAASAAASTDDNALDFDLTGLSTGMTAAAASAALASSAAGLSGDRAAAGGEIANSSLIERATERAETDGSGDLDFDLAGFETPSQADGDGDVPTVEEDLSGVWPVEGEESIAAMSHLDFNLDVGGETATGLGLREEPAEEEAPAPQLDGTLASLSLDSLDGSNVIPQPEATESPGLDFDLGGMEDAETAPAAGSSSDASVSDLGSGQGATSSDTTGLEFDLDGTEMEPASELNLELDDFSREASTDAQTRTGKGGDSASELSAVDLDLSFGEEDSQASEAGAGGVDFDLSFSDETGAESEPDTTSHVDIDLSFSGATAAEAEAASASADAGPGGSGTTATDVQSADGGVTGGAGDELPIVPTVRLGPGQMSTVRLASKQLGEDEPADPTTLPTEVLDAAAGPESSQETDFLDIFTPSDDDSQGDDEPDIATALGGLAATGDGTDDVQTKIDLAQTYIDMEDIKSAREVLSEVMGEGSPDQQALAKRMISTLDDDDA